MRYYGQSLEQVYDTSIVAFWFLLNQISRIQAETDLRTLSVHVAIAGGADGVKNRQEELIKELGIVSKGVSTTFDAEGWDSLKEL